MEERIVYRKKGGRPNRGGGRGRGRGHARGRGGASRGRSAEHGGADNRQKADASQPSAKVAADVRVPMQRLYMSQDNQDMVMDMLRDLQGVNDSFSQSDDGYEERDFLDYDDYWTNDNTLLVGEVVPFSEPVAVEPDPYENLNRIAVNKLVRYGYDRDRCKEALLLYDGDIGGAFEYLFCKCFDVQVPGSTPDLDPTDYSDIHEPDKAEKTTKEILTERGRTPEDIEDMRNEEIEVLRSIYDDSFIEKIPNKVWLLRLELHTLKDLVVPSTKGIYGDDDSAKNAEICKFYMKGSCRFGSKCKYSHKITADLEGTKEDKLSSDNANFELEVRFRKDSIYPLQPPIIGFSSLLPQFPPEVCLNITEKLLAEAEESAQSELPAVYSLVSILEDESALVELIMKPAHDFSLPETSWAESVRLNSQAKPGQSHKSKSDNVVKKTGLVVIDDGDLEAQDPAKEMEVMMRMVRSPEGRRDEEEKENGHHNNNDDGNTPGRIRKRTSSREQDTTISRVNPTEVLKQNRKLKDEYQRKKQSSKQLHAMLSQRKKLPAWNKQSQIVETINDNQVIVVSGMTGCGKTTQVPQFILDLYLSDEKSLKMCNILCTQPRRISAISVAERVAEERAEALGKSVGYQIRLEKVQSSMTRLLFCTTGVVLRRLEGDSELQDVTHIIIDEVHERSEESDFLMMYLRDMLPNRKDLKVILMSATLNADLFSEYFNGCSVIDIPGKTFPVQSYFLEDAIEFTHYMVDERSPFARRTKLSDADRKGLYMQGMYDESLVNTDLSKPAGEKVRDELLTVKQLQHRYSDLKKSTCKCISMMDLDKVNYDLIIELLEWIVEGDHEFPHGAILIFLPGFAEIQQLYDMLFSNRLFGAARSARFKIIPLHSTLSSEDQHSVFLKPPEGVTKIVIATNIAETSITIDDIVFVIDSGKMKEKKYDSSKGMESLETVWVSEANALQRRGRAGRVTSGVCFHLFTSHRFDYRLQAQPIPEIQRAPLEQICLRIKMLKIFKDVSVQEVLWQLPEPPDEDSILSAIKRLQDLGALDDQDELTPLGYHLGSLPVDVRVGKLMLLGAIFRCLDPALTIAATLSFKSPFVSPFDKKNEADKKKLEFATGFSDHLTMLNAYKGWIEAKEKGSNNGYRFCHDNFLSIKSLQMLASMKQQFVELLSDIGFVREGINVRDVERAARNVSDGVIEVTGNEANINSTNWKLVSAILVGSLYPNVVQVMKPESKFSHGRTGAVPKDFNPDELKFRTKLDGNVHIHPSSINFQVRYYESPYLVYHEKIKTTKIYIRDCTMVGMYPLLLFGGGSISVDLDRGNFVLSIDDGWIRFMAESSKVAELVREVRTQLDQLLEDKISNPHMDLCNCPKGSKIIDTIVQLITSQ